MQIANDVSQTLGPQPDPDTVVAHVDALDEKAHQAGLLGWKQLVPDAVEVGERPANRVGMQAGRPNCPRHNLRSPDQPSDMLDHGLVDRAGWHPPDRPVVLATLNGDGGDVVAIATPFLAGMLRRHRPAVGSEDQPAQQRHVARRGNTRPRPGSLPEYGLSFVPEVLCDEGLMLAGVGFLLVDGEADVGPVLQDLVKNDLVERPPERWRTPSVSSSRSTLVIERSITNRWNIRRTIAEPAGSMPRYCSPI